MEVARSAGERARFTRRAVSSARTAATALAATVAAALPRPGAAATLRADPPSLRLGEDRGATACLDGADGAPGATDVEFLASVGRFEGAHARDGGVCARYVAPEGRAPAVAVLAARVRGHGGAPAAWTALPLVGRVEISFATEPGARVTVTLGTESLGPFVAPRSGRFVRRFAVPPGTPAATIRAIDAAGNVRTETVSLDGPDWPPGLLLAHDATTPDAAGAGIVLTALLVRADGAPRADPPAAAAVGGAVDVWPDGVPGRYRVLVTPVVTAFGGLVRVHVGGDDGRPPLEWSGRIAPAVPARVALDAFGVLRAAEEATVTVRVFTDAGAPLAGISAWISVTTTWGAVEVVEETLPGLYSARYRGGARLPAPREVRLEAAVTSPAAAPVRATLVRAARAGDPVALEVASTSPVIAGPAAVASVRAVARDAAGNGVAGLSLTARLADSPDAAPVAMAAAGAEGAYEARVPLPRARPGPVRIVATERGGLSAGVNVPVAPRPRALRLVLGGSARGAWNLRDAGAASLGAHVDVARSGEPWLAAGLALGGLVALGSEAPGEGTRLVLGAGGVEATLRVRAAIGRASWRIGARVEAGGALLRGAVSVAAPVAVSRVPFTALVPAAHAAAEVALRLGPGWLVAALGGSTRPLPDGLPVAGNLGGLAAALSFEVER